MRSRLDGNAVLFIIAVSIFPFPAFAGKKVPALSASATHDCCVVFVTSILRPTKKIRIQTGTRLVTQGTAVFSEPVIRTLEASPEGGDHFVGITVVVSGMEEARRVPLEQWKASRPSGFAEDAALVFPDGTVVPAQLGSVDDGLPAQSNAGWAPGVIMTDPKTGTVVYRNYIFQPKDEYLAVETMYFPIHRQSWKSMKPTHLRIGGTDIPFDVKKWPN